MFLSEQALHHALERVQAAFPHFTHWEYVNDRDEGALGGCSLWGRFVLNPDEIMPRYFYITFATYADHWSGHVTIGQHYYFWTSADVGDAHILDTAECTTLEEAIVALKAEIVRLFSAFSGA